ncbi:MAG TPA: AAA domain-containing protein [Gemmataceae bacterium]|nr:AAA domain-containing protein [Gemmataceae bacterium]
MTHRERHTPAEAPARDATRPPPVVGLESDSSSGPAPPPPSETSLWADWYHRASPAQQQDALLRAIRQGVLYAHQLDAPIQNASPSRSLLTRLLHGQVKELEPLHPPAVQCHDCTLDRTQREAVARAVATPDVCLIQGFPGTGKSRLLSEIILQAAQRGERILFLASTTAALDTVLERLSSNPAVCPIRYLVEDEQLSSLPAAIARLTLPERLRCYQETTLPAARAARDAVARTLAERLRERARWDRLAELLEQHEQLAERLRSLTERRNGVAAEVERLEQLTTELRERWQACERARAESLERVDSQLAGLQAELDTIAGKLNHLDSEWQAIRPLAEARQGRRFWTPSWWRAVLQNGLKEQACDLEARRDELRAAQRRLEQELAARRSERTQIETHHAAECRRLREDEIARRRAELDVAIAADAPEQEALRKQWQSIREGLSGDAAPAEMSRQAMQEGLAVWEKLRERDAQRMASAEQWLQTVADGIRTLPEKLAGSANVIAATTMSLAGGILSGGTAGSPVFDLLILEEAHQVTESQLATAARHARRWVLIGEPQIDAEPVAELRKAVRPSVLRPSLFQRLWQNLHTDPHCLPFNWRTRDGRLLCRLRPLAPDQEKWIETEPVVDRPDIELRILSMPRQAPQVVEILFPSCMGIGEAKQFLFHELEELAVQTHGRSLSWTETAEELILELVPSSDAESVTVALESGVRERVAALPVRGGRSWHTCSLEFTRAAGWTRQRAEEWIADRLGLRSTGRTVLLTVPYRLDPSLACFLSDLLFAGACQPPSAPAKVSWSLPPVEFVAVPTPLAGETRYHLDSEDRDHGGETAPISAKRGSGGVSVRAPRPRTVKGGAGLELDLADDRPLPQLPAELRALLPRQGLANYLEARALVQRLEALIQDNDFLSACTQWRQQQPWPCGHGCVSPSACACPCADNAPAVAVMALYPAQVELLRHLIAQSPALSSSPITMEVGLPLAFSHRECLLALVSLTRSHTHRAVSYADHPHAFAQALTRASSGLILFGDPGTLMRRSQWRGRLDHLDESAAQHESSWIGQLVQYLHGHGAHPEAFRIREGISV